MKTFISKTLVSSGVILLLAGCAAGGEAATRSATVDHAREEAACTGIPEAHRATGLFGAGSTAAKVEPLVEQVKIGKQTYPRTMGAKVTVVAEPGLTKPWLTRLAECHTALRQAGNVTISVVEAPTSFVVSLRSASPADAERVLHVAENMNLRLAQDTQRNAGDTRSASAGALTQ